MDDLLERAADERLDNRAMMTLQEAIRRQHARRCDCTAGVNMTNAIADSQLAYDMIRFSIASAMITNIGLGDQSMFDALADFALTYMSSPGYRWSRSA